MPSENLNVARDFRALRVLRPAGIALIVAVLFTAMSLPAMAGNTHALSDVNSIPPAADITCPTTGIHAATSPLRAISLATALGNLEEALKQAADPKALKTLEASPEVQNPGAATNIAAVALVDHMPDASLALLLLAQHNDPKNPMPLVNLAAMANYLGAYQEAYAAVSSAEKLAGATAPRVKQGLLVNKGNALLGLGYPQEAQAAFHAALGLAPDLAEAYTSMAFALGDQQQCDQAVRFARAGAYHQPVYDMVEATQGRPEDTQSRRPDHTLARRECDRSVARAQRHPGATALRFQLRRGQGRL